MNPYPTSLPSDYSTSPSPAYFSTSYPISPRTSPSSLHLCLKALPRGPTPYPHTRRRRPVRQISQPVGIVSRTRLLPSGVHLSCVARRVLGVVYAHEAVSAGADIDNQPSTHEWSPFGRPLCSSYSLDGRGTKASSGLVSSVVWTVDPKLTAEKYCAKSKGPPG